MFEVKVPSLGESETEATLISWLKDEGDEVQVDDIIAEIESDKITMEITATESGILTEQRFAVDDTVEPGQVIGIIDTSVAVTARDTEAETEGATQLSSTAPEQQLTAENAPLSLAEREQVRLPMSRIRKRIASRLKEAQNTAAMLTTFNEVNMQPIMDIRQEHKQAFEEKHGVKLGFMSFFL